MTGRKMDARVFLGPTFYQRLKHLVDDKIFSRQRGQVQILTRQPVEGMRGLFKFTKEFTKNLMLFFTRM
jgi:DNA-directed RNA polymerase beta subunit